MSALARWYAQHGRHDLPWRATRDRWPVLVSEVMLAQTQVARVIDVWPRFMAAFPTVSIAALSSPGAVIAAWGRLGYPRRARRLWDAARAIDRDGWPSDYTTLAGVGRYTAGALAAQADDERNAVAVDVNIRRVVQRVRGAVLSTSDAERELVRVGGSLRGRDRLLAVMDLGAMVCRPREPDCANCPLRPRCATRGTLPGERRARQAAYAGSFRERRGVVLARLRAGSGAVPVADLDAEALASLVADGLAAVRRGRASLPVD